MNTESILKVCKYIYYIWNILHILHIEYTTYRISHFITVLPSLALDGMVGPVKKISLVFQNYIQIYEPLAPLQRKVQLERWPVPPLTQSHKSRHLVCKAYILC